MSDAVMEGIEFRVTLPWRKAGCEGWRIRDAQKRFRLGEYDAVEVRFADGSTSVIAGPDAAPPPSSVSTGSRPQEAILPQTEKGS